MSIETDIKQFIASEILSAEQASEISDEDPLISSGRVDSMGLLHILGFIQRHFGVDLMAVGNPQDFDTVQGLAAAVRRSKGE